MRLTTRAELNFTFNLNLTEGEMRALDAMVGYGFDSFITVFKEKLGSHYMEGCENDLKKVFASIDELRANLTAIDAAKKAAIAATEKYKHL